MSPGSQYNSAIFVNLYDNCMHPCVVKQQPLQLCITLRAVIYTRLNVNLMGFEFEIGFEIGFGITFEFQCWITCLSLTSCLVRAWFWSRV